MIKLNIDQKQRDKFLAAFTSLPNEVSEMARKTLKTFFKDVQVEASTNHKYTARSGNLDKAYFTWVDKSGLFGKTALSKTISNAPYAFRIHEGFVGQTDSLGRTFKGPKPDRFLTDAGDKLADSFQDRIVSMIKRAIKKVGL